MARILVLGCGRLGLPFALDMAASGHTVTGVKRSIPEDADPRLEWLAMDITDPDAMAGLDASFDLVIIILTPLSRSPEGYQKIYQQGMERVLSRLSVGARIVFVSATSVYAQDQGEWVDEDSDTSPQTYNGRSLLSAERTVLGWGSGNVVIRFSGIYGPDRRRLLTSLEKPVEVQESPPQYTNRIHQRDCVGVLGFISARLLAGETVPEILCASDGDPAPRADVLSWIAREAGLIPPTLITVATDGATRNKRVRNDRLRELGYRFHYPDFRAGYRQMLSGGQPG